MNTTDDDTYLKQVQKDISLRLLPVIVLVAVLGFIGVCGNILSFIFYAFKSTRSSTVILIASLAAVDLIVCVLCIPNVIEMFLNVIYTDSFICKLTHFIGLWAVAVSCLILWLVSIDRHRKICRPFGKQVTMDTTKYAIIGFVIFGLLMSVRNFANFETNEVNVSVRGSNRTVTGRYCTTSDKENLKLSVTVFTVIDFVLMLAVWTTLVVAYTHIIIKLLKLRKKRQAAHSRARTFNNPIYEVNATMNVSKIRTKDNQTDATSASSSNTLEENRNGKGFTCLTMNEDSGIERSETSCQISEQQSKGSPTKLSDDNSKETKSLSDTNVTLWLVNRNTPQDSNVYRQTDLSNIPGSKENDVDNINRKASCGKHVTFQEIKDIKRDDSISGISQEHESSQATTGSTMFSHEESSISKSESKMDGSGKERKLRRRRYNSSKCPVERNVTLKMLTVSAIFIVCFTPYFVVKILMRVVYQTGEEYELDLASQLALRLPYMNSVFNPVVYVIFNSNFRRFVKYCFLDHVWKCCKIKEILRKGHSVNRRNNVSGNSS